MPTDSVLLNLEGSNGKIQVAENFVRIELYKQKMITLPPPKWDSSKISKAYDIPRNTITKVELADFLGTHQFHVYFPKAGLGGFVNIFIRSEQKVQAEEMLKILTRIETSTRDATSVSSNVLNAIEHSAAKPPLEEGLEDRQPNNMDTDISQAPPTWSIADELTKLAALKRDGAITEEEYAQLKKELLSGHAMPIPSNELKAIENSDSNPAQEGVEDRQQNEEALKAYEKTVETEPQSAEAWSDKGSAFEDLGEYDEALEAYDKAIEIDPQYAGAWNNKGTALCGQGKYDEAIKAYDKAIELNPQMAEAWGNKGTALLGKGKYDEAIHAFDKAIEAKPQYAEAWNNKGIVLGKQGKYGDAIKAHDEAIEINPQLASAWTKKGFALVHQGKFDEAIKAYDKAIEINPQDAEALGSKKMILEKLENSKKPKVIENKEFSTRSGSVEFDTCPVCKTGRLLVTDKKKFLGIITHHDVICNNSGCNMKLNDQQAKEFMREWEHQRNIDLNIWLTGIRRGQGLPIDHDPPIMLKKNESSIFTIPNISLSEDRSVRTGGYTSSRFRVAKGVSIGGGTFRSRSHDELTAIDTGTLTLTNQRIVFVGKSHSSDIPLKKIISIEPYKNAIVVGKEGRAKTQQFTGTDKSYLHIAVGGRTWRVPITGVIINTMVEALAS